VRNWERKAAQAKDAAEILMGDSAKARMLEMADHYAKLASAARRGIAIPGQGQTIALNWT
jgi:hypothetical protein